MNNIRHFPTALTLMRRISALRLVRRSFMLPADLVDEIVQVECEVRSRGLRFPLDHQVATFLRSALKVARAQLEEFDSEASNDFKN